MNAAATSNQSRKMERYYQLHAGIYDATRWAFLFGRRRLVELAARGLPPAARVLEIGCGTGKNLERLARLLPRASLLGVDAAQPMLDVAARRLRAHAGRVELRRALYTQPVGGAAGFDLILVSYCLTMVNPGWEEIVRAAMDDLAPGGCLAVADFHHSPVRAFRSWMSLNHVRMEGQLLPGLLALPLSSRHETRSAYFGLWRYFTYIGKKAGPDFEPRTEH